MSGIPTAWWRVEGAEAAKRLGSEFGRGLPAAEAARRLKTHGLNRLPEPPGPSPFRLLLRQFDSLLVWVLIAAAAIASFLGERVDAWVIVAIVLLNAGIGFVQEHRAERALAALRRLASPSSRVLRGGTMRVVPSAELVPGDLVLVEAGDRVPADGRLLKALRLRAQEAALTGESVPVGKTEETLSAEKLPLGDRRNMLFLGTTVVQGRGELLVTETAAATELGRIAELLAGPGDQTTPLQEQLETLGTRLVWLCAAITGVVMAAGLWRGMPGIEMLMLSVSLAVAAIPEGLPAVVTISLALGVHRMAARRALVRRLAAVETLGCATVVCTDKTGTLTRNEMTVRAAWAAGRLVSVSGAGYEPKGGFKHEGSAVSPGHFPALLEALKIGALCNGAELVQEDGGWGIAGDPTEGALLVAAAKAGLLKGELEKGHPALGELPFDSDRKRMSVLRKAADGPVLFVKGAPDVLLERSTRILLDGGPAPLTEEWRERIIAANEELAGRAMRVLAAAARPFAGKRLDDGAEEDLTFVGLLAMMDPPRPEARHAVATCRKAGLLPVMVTGDHRATALAVGRELGLIRDGAGVLDGAELDGLSDAELGKMAPGVQVYARVSAEHKLRIVRAWRARGEVVAMTGDGVNDAPALKEADIGVAMGVSGTDVSREASDMVLLDDNFASIVNAVEEGRGVYDNIVKVVFFLLASNLAEVLVIALAVLGGVFFPDLHGFLPLTAAQILWINLITDGLPALALAADPASPRAMSRPPRDAARPIVSPRFMARLSLQAVLVAAAALCAGYWGWAEGPAVGRTMALTTLMTTELAWAQLVRLSYGGRFWTNRWLFPALAGSLLLHAAILYVPSLSVAFGTVPLHGKDWALVLALVSAGVLAGVGLNKLLPPEAKP